MSHAVSVVLSVFNGASYLPRTIDSVLRQSRPDFEFIIVNDGSNDDSVATLLNRYATSDSRIHVISRDNAGLTAALIAGCAATSGRYIARIDNGDEMLPDRLARQSAILERFEDCVLASCRTEFVGPEWEHLWSTDSVPTSEPVEPLPDGAGARLKIDIPHHGSVMFRRSAYLDAGGYRREFFVGQDWDLWYRLAERGRFYVIPEVLYRARIFPNAVSMAAAAEQRRIAEISFAALQARRKGQDDAELVAAAARIRPGRSGKRSAEPGLYFIGERLRRNHDPACRLYLRAAIRQRPWSARAWLRLLQSAAIQRA